MIGHISLGIEVANALWREGEATEGKTWAELKPASEELRDHLLHLIASHHGTKEFGSPVAPKTPEAFLLHHIDNIDAKMEMLRLSYARGKGRGLDWWRRTDRWRGRCPGRLVGESCRQGR